MDNDAKINRMIESATSSITNRDCRKLEMRFVEHEGKKGAQIYDANGLPLLGYLIPNRMAADIMAIIKLSKRRGQP